jgi:uncharacterized protein (TIGR03435 family)
VIGQFVLADSLKCGFAALGVMQACENTGPDGAGIDYGLPPAVEKQLGLKMDPRKMPTEMLIVVSALKVPKEN